MQKMIFENGTLVTPAKVIINGTEHEVIPAVYSGNTPFSAENINGMQDNMKEAVDTQTYVGDLNDIVENCTKYCVSATTNKPNTMAGWCTTTMHPTNTAYAYQEYICIDTTNINNAANGTKYYRYKVNGTWKNWSSFNIITTGIEFKTGRIIDGKEEYGKRINIGALPNATDKSIPTGLTNVKYTGMRGMATNNSSFICLPATAVSSMTQQVNIYITNNSIYLQTGNDRSSYTGTVTVYYTKN